MDNERRGMQGLELRSVEGRTLPTIVGRPIVFNSLSEELREPGYGRFREIVRPSFARSLQEGNPDLRALVDHDAGKVIGRSKSGTLRYIVDSQGVLVEIDPPDTTHGRDIVESVRRGDIDGMSFSFRATEDEVRQENGETIRELIDGEIPEFSIVAWPAYQATSVQVRSLRTFAARQAEIWLENEKKRLDLLGRGA